MKKLEIRKKEVAKRIDKYNKSIKRTETELVYYLNRLQTIISDNPNLSISPLADIETLEALKIVVEVGK